MKTGKRNGGEGTYHLGDSGKNNTKAKLIIAGAAWSIKSPLHEYSVFNIRPKGILRPEARICPT